MPRNLQQGDRPPAAKVPVIPGHDPDFPDIALLAAPTIDLTEDAPPLPRNEVITISNEDDEADDEEEERVLIRHSSRPLKRPGLVIASDQRKNRARQQDNSNTDSLAGDLVRASSSRGRVLKPTAKKLEGDGRRRT